MQLASHAVLAGSGPGEMKMLRGRGRLASWRTKVCQAAAHACPPIQEMCAFLRAIPCRRVLDASQADAWRHNNITKAVHGVNNDDCIWLFWLWDDKNEYANQPMR